MFHLEKTLIITSPWSPPTFLFLLEQVPADPCPSGNHEGRTITDITLLSTIFLLETCRPPQTGPIPHENPGSSQGIWVRRLYIQDNCIFPAAPHSQGRDHMEPPPSSGVKESPCSPAGLSPSLRACSLHPVDSKTSFLWRAYWLVGKINCLPETPTSPLEFLCEGP